MKRSVPLDVALRFAAAVRSERFHNPEDVFVVDDSTGEAVSESTRPEQATAPAPVPRALAFSLPAAVDDIADRLHDEVPAPVAFAEGWQLRHAQVTLRGGQRLTASVERSLAQLTRLMELLRCSNTLMGEAEQVAAESASALEHLRRAQEGLRRAEAKLAEAEPAADVAASLKALTDANLADCRTPARKRSARAKV